MIHKLIFSTPEQQGKLLSKALFLDRDGIINKRPKTHEYVAKWKDFVLNTRVLKLIKLAQRKSYKIIIITNQRGIGRGLMSNLDFIDLSNKLCKYLSTQGIALSAIYYCPHDFQHQCLCRKPKPGLFTSAIKDHMIDPNHSISIGDSDTDSQAAKEAGITNIYQIPSNKLETLRITEIFKD